MSRFNNIALVPVSLAVLLIAQAGLALYFVG